LGFSPIRALALSHNLRACWSTPIVATDGRVLGTFALYYREPHAPTVQDQHVIDVATDIAGIAIARQRADDEHAQLLREQGARAEAEALRARFEEVFRRAPALIGLVQGPEHVVEYANPLFIQTVGGRDCRGLPVRQVVPELAGQGYFELLDQVYATGEPAMGTEARVSLDRDGTPEEGFFKK
jgi:GAF domain-containing protein